MLETRLRQVMAGVLGLDADAVDDTTSVETVEQWDSLHHMNLVIAIEDEFGVRLPEDEIASLTSLPAFRVVLMRLAPAAASESPAQTPRAP